MRSLLVVLVVVSGWQAAVMAQDAEGSSRPNEGPGRGLGADFGSLLRRFQTQQQGVQGCMDGTSGEHKDVGSRWGGQGCVLHECHEGGIITLCQCDKSKVPEGCQLEQPDEKADFPNCCPRIKCPPQGKVVLHGQDHGETELGQRQGFGLEQAGQGQGGAGLGGAFNGLFKSASGAFGGSGASGQNPASPLDSLKELLRPFMSPDQMQSGLSSFTKIFGQNQPMQPLELIQKFLGGLPSRLPSGLPSLQDLFKGLQAQPFGQIPQLGGGGGEAIGTRSGVGLSQEQSSSKQSVSQKTEDTSPASGGNNPLSGFSDFLQKAGANGGGLQGGLSSLFSGANPLINGLRVPQPTINGFPGLPDLNLGSMLSSFGGGAGTSTSPLAALSGGLGAEAGAGGSGSNPLASLLSQLQQGSLGGGFSSSSKTSSSSNRQGGGGFSALFGGGGGPSEDPLQAPQGLAAGLGFASGDKGANSPPGGSGFGWNLGLGGKGDSSPQPGTPGPQTPGTPGIPGGPSGDQASS